jgi:hypothetical protein
MLTGRPPFEGNNPVSIAYKHVEENPPPPSSIDPAIPAQLEAVAMKAMAKQKQDRFQTAGQMADDLQRAAPSMAVAATGSSFGQKPTAVLPVGPEGPASTAPLPTSITQQRRRPWLLAAGAAGVAILGVAVAFALGNDEVPDGRARTGLETPGTSAPPPTAPTTPTPAATSPLPPVPSVADAFQEVLEARQEVFERAQEAVLRYQEGNGSEAVAKLFELRGKIAELTEEGRIAPQEAGSILEAIDVLELAMRAAPPPSPTGEDEGDGGPGKGKGRGQNGGGNED